MCECGCGSYRGGFSLPGPDGSVYVLEYYPSCKDCDTPSGVRVNRWDPLPGDDDNARDYAEFLKRETKTPLLMRQEQPHQAVGYLPVVEPWKVYEEIKEGVVELEVEHDDLGKPIGILLDLVSSEIVEAIRDSVEKTMSEKTLEEAEK